MKILIALLSTLVIYSSLQAQETTAPEAKPEGLPEKPAATDAVSPPLTDPMSLIPEALPNIEKTTTPSRREPLPSVTETAEDSLKKAKTSAAADALKERIHFREIKTRAVKDEQVQEQFDRAQSAKTDPEKRDALKRYYTLLYARMLKIDSSLKAQIKLRQDDAIRRLEQPKVNETDRDSE